MAGFTAVFSKNKNIKVDFTFREKNFFGHKNNYQKRILSGDGFIIEQFTNNKFHEDKVFDEDGDFIIGIEGVILNLKQLKHETKQLSTFELIKSLFQKDDVYFVKKLKGDFSGFVYSKQDDKLYIFTNHIGSKRVFYFHNDKYFIFASELRDISFLMKKLGVVVKLNRDAAYLMLTYGFMLEDITLISDVKRLAPGSVLTFENDEIHINEYFHLRNISPTTDNHTQIIEKMDTLFSEAIQLEFEKDKEYGYQHFATLSGGLDSRMVVLMAHQLGYSNQLNFCFSQANYLDEKIAKKIASDYQHEFLFQSLDNGNYLKDIEKTVFYNDGLVLYSGSAHVMKCIENVNFDSFGLIHTGLIGDAVIGSFLSKPCVVLPNIHSGAYSTKLISKITPLLSTIISGYKSEELFKFYGRGFLGALNGNYYFDIFSQTVSPFLNIDFLSYCYSIPEHLKFKQKIYLEWIESKHREFADYPWEKTGVSPLKSINYKKYFVVNYYKRMSLKFFDKISGKMQSGMNPYDFWMLKNKSLADYTNIYFNQNIELLNFDSELIKDCTELYKTGNSGEKFQVLTILAALKLHNIKS